ncbi:MAG: hypothetical protein JWM27_1801 [Gemmatimonadetes bacterium]|nr:hypothetical protein [Gemmatimonadota bacterium]
MLAQLLFLLALLACAVGAAARAERGRGVRLPAMVAYAAMGLVCVLVVLNDFAPFTRGDDSTYYLVSVRTLEGLRAWVDFRQFPGFEQGGYPLLLTWVNQLAGDSVLARKAVNLFFYLLLAVVWFQVGEALEGRRTGYAFAAAMLVATPLWPYWFWLLKDMLIVLLQSAFLLGMVRLVAHGRRRGAWVLIGGATLLLIPLRSPLVLLNAAVLAGTVVLAGNRSRLRKAGMIAGAAVLLSGLLYVGTRASLLSALGAQGAGRGLDPESLRTAFQLYRDQGDGFSGPLGVVAFPVLYLFGETAGLRLDALASRSDVDMAIRGLTALPWIFLGSPLFLYGLVLVARGRHPDPETGPAGAPALYEPALRPNAGAGDANSEPGDGATSPPAARVGWIPLLLFLGLYAVLAWIVHDTTRWRMPAFPVMVAVAAYAWRCLRAGSRALLLTAWAGALASVFVVYYVVVK